MNTERVILGNPVKLKEELWRQSSTRGLGRTDQER